MDAVHPLYKTPAQAVHGRTEHDILCVHPMCAPPPVMYQRRPAILDGDILRINTSAAASCTAATAPCQLLRQRQQLGQLLARQQ
jgi:hypothetical protein